jgi:hypothetical protein
MGENRAHQRLRDTAATKLRNHKHVRQIREYCAIRDDAGKRNLPTGGVRAEAQGISDRALDSFATAALSPIRSPQKIVNS